MAKLSVQNVLIHFTNILDCTMINYIQQRDGRAGWY